MLIDEFNEIARELEVHHGIFQKFWELGKPVFTDKVEVAEVYYDKEGRTLNFKLNPDKWTAMTKKQRAFTIAHQCLHVLLYHGFRISNLNKEDRNLADQALDIVTNHSLVNNFGYDRNEIDPDNELCWLDKVFPAEMKVPGDRSFEYYYNLIKQQSKQDQPSSGDQGQGQGQPQHGETDHEGLESFCDEDFSNFMNEEVVPQLEPQEAKSAQEFIESETGDIASQISKLAGAAPGNSLKSVQAVAVPKKKKWEAVIKKWLRKTWNDVDSEQWTKKSRRMANMSSDFILPCDDEVEDIGNNKLNLWFFLDTSGSCAHLADRFFKAALSVPNDKFNMKLFCFDTKVYTVSLKDKQLFGFGGTSFTCIEDYIQDACRKSNKGYPDSVFLITDGYGNKVEPRYPNRWFWFLSENERSCIPKSSAVFSLKDFE